MNRRRFIGTACAAATASALPRLGASTAGRTKPAPIKSLAGLRLKELRDQYYSYIYDDFLPFMEKYVIDTEFGGFMCQADRDGTRLGTSKTPTNEGRGIWVWSYLYSVLSKEQKYLDVAKRSLDLILKSRPEGDTLWPRSLTREGEPAAAADATVYGDLYIAAGIAEYARAACLAMSTSNNPQAPGSSHVVLSEHCCGRFSPPQTRKISAADFSRATGGLSSSLLVRPNTDTALLMRITNAA